MSDEGGVVETRDVHQWVSQSRVVVFREGSAMPTDTLVNIVNTAHTVLVLRGTDEYFYLRDDFVLSTRDEEALMEWCVGRPLFANSLLAVGGTLMVAFAGKIWRPAVVGTLLVAASGYLVQGALTKVLRVKSGWWTKHMLVPSGIHGTERVMQFMLVTVVALADLLDDSVLLLTALTLASAQVVLLEYVGQVRLRWGYAEYNRILCVQLEVWTGVCAGLVAWLWLSYVFAGFFGCNFFGLVLNFLYACVRNIFFADAEGEARSLFLSIAIALGSVGVGIWAAVLDWDEAHLKFSPQSLQPWRWPLVHSPDSFSTVVRIVGLWVCVCVACFIAVFIVVGVFSFNFSSAASIGLRSGERTRVRMEKASSATPTNRPPHRETCSCRGWGSRHRT